MSLTFVGWTAMRNGLKVQRNRFNHHSFAIVQQPFYEGVSRLTLQTDRPGRLG